MFSMRSWTAAAGTLIVGLLLAACGSSSTTTNSTATTAKAAAAATVGVGTTSLGSVVVDASGLTVYKFDKDTVGSGTSACTGNCATTWPAETVSGTPTAGTGVPGTIGVITRTDGTQQVTLDGHPLYHFSGDKAAGDTNGNGIGGIWHVVTTSGAASSSGGTATTAPGGTHY